MDGSGNVATWKASATTSHLNPTRARLIRPEQSPADYPWSSLRGYLQSPRKRPAWLRVDRLLGEWGIRRDDRRGRLQFQAMMVQRHKAEQEDWRGLRRSWCCGSEDVSPGNAGVVLSEDAGEHHYGEELHETAEAKAERLVGEALRRARWQEKDWALRRKTDPVKVALAARLRRETTMGWRWIAERLHMGHWRTAANAVHLRK